MADFSFKSVLRESRRIAVFSDLSLLLLYVCAVNLPLFCDFRRCFLWKSQCLVHWYQEATNMWQVLGSATVSSLLLWGRLNACLLVCCDLCFAFYCFFCGDCRGSEKTQWSLYAHACFISIFNQKSQDHMKCPHQCSEQHLRCKTQWDYRDRAWQQKPCNIHSIARSNP